MNIIGNISIKVCIAGDKNLLLFFIVKNGEMLSAMLIICDLLHKSIEGKWLLIVNISKRDILTPFNIVKTI